MNYRLFKQGGETLDLNVMNINGWLTSQRNMRLAQAPGGTQAFVIGRATRQTTPIRLRILVDEDTEDDARTTLGVITRFAKASTMIARITSGVESEHTRLQTNPLAGITPEPMHLGATTWSTLLELRPLVPANTTTAVTRITLDGSTRTTLRGRDRLVFTEAP